VNGLLPRWTDWWADEDVAPMFPDAQTKRRVTDEQPYLPLSYYEQKIPIEPGWSKTPSGYLLFSAPYAEVAEQARGRGWPVLQVPGEHLHMVVEPDRVGSALIELSGLLTA
jgi:hypothetical protein